LPSDAAAVCVVQARMGSTRLPGKVLADIDGRPMLRFMLDRLAALTVAKLVVATSALDRDDPIEAVATAAGVAVVRGSEHDVLDRFRLAVETYPAPVVIRLTGDCPLTDASLVTDVLARHRDTAADYTSNVFPRTFPKGLDVEVMTRAALDEAVEHARLPIEREHVTPYLYRHPERFRLANLSSGLLLGDERWTVDTADDLTFVRGLVERMGGDGHFTWRQAFECVGATASRPPGALWLRPVSAADADRVREWRNDPESLRFSRTTEPVGAATHEAWFATRLDNPQSRFWVGVVDDVAVGFVRIDVADAQGRVSLAVDPSERGRGHGTAMLVAAQRQLALDLQVDVVTAEVSPDNAASRRAFLAAGFTHQGVVDGFERFAWNNARQ
jgi:spore coat polysaccharide biosynthesis protein SpsF